jgi:large subunit ribosomal protein L29
MKAAELRDLGTDELETRAHELDEQLFRLRMQKSMGQQEAGHKLQAVRRDLARLRTIIRERQGQA